MAVTRSRRRLLSALTGFAALALTGLTAKEARATWHCDVPDGPTSTYPGALNAKMTASSAVLLNGSPVPLYQGVDANKRYVRYGRWYSQLVLGLPTWHLGTLDADNLTTTYYVNPGMPGALGGSSIWTAYGVVAVDGLLAFGQGTSSPVVNEWAPTDPLSDWVVGAPSIVSYGGEVFVFYYTRCGGLYFVRYDGTSWSAPTLVDSLSCPTGPGPVALVFNGQLFIVYQYGQAITYVTYDGSTWVGRAYLTLSGENPSAIVDTSANVLHVFYTDDSLGALRDASMPAGAGWSRATVDTASPGTYSVPVLQSNTTQVYYTANGSQGPIRGATLVDGSWTWQATIDGGSGSLCGTNGGTSHTLGGPIAGVTWNGGPHLFYSDLTTGDLRTAFWQ